MASAELHIKDSYYFEVPKILLPSHARDKADFEHLKSLAAKIAAAII